MMVHGLQRATLCASFGCMNTPTKTTSRRRLIATARARKGHAVASTWQAHARPDGSVAVVHHTTHMFDVNADDTVTAVNPGWGSMTDKCGTGIILSGAGIAHNYASVFG